MSLYADLDIDDNRGRNIDSLTITERLRLARSMPEVYSYTHPRPAVTVDCAVFCRSEDADFVLLVKRKNEPFKGQWALPGGFVNQNEDLEAAACRELFEETGLALASLHQVRTYGKPGRDPRGHVIAVLHTTVLYGHTPPVMGADDAAEARWVSVSTPLTYQFPLAFDHADMVSKAWGWNYS